MSVADLTAPAGRSRLGAVTSARVYLDHAATTAVLPEAIAAMSAEGTSTIQNIEQIDRGYKDIDGRLNALGARITRVEE